MKLHELPRWVPPTPRDEERARLARRDEPAIVITSTEVEEDEDEEWADDEGLAEACRLLRHSYKVFSHLMMLDSIYHTLSAKEQELMVEHALAIFQFLEVWDLENGEPEEAAEPATDRDYIDHCGM